tara:strand:+ start:1755 stop:2240 length:486 start_codon:yes stop_codon:yes gene_type:complete
VPDDPAHPNRHYPAQQAWKSQANRSVIVFITVCSKQRQPLFADHAIHQLLIQEWSNANTWAVGRYVILPDHIHLFASPCGDEAPDVRRWIRFWKSKVTQKWPLPHDGSIWQTNAWDRQLRAADSYAQKWEYVRNNPVRHGLVEKAKDWPYQGELNQLMWHD